MTEKQRFNYRQLIGSIIGSIIVFMVGFSVTASREDSKDIKRLIDLKVDKTEYNDQCDKAEQRFSNIENSQNEILKEMNKALQIIAVQNASMQNDIVWIKKDLERKK